MALQAPKRADTKKPKQNWTPNELRKPAREEEREGNREGEGRERERGRETGQRQTHKHINFCDTVGKCIINI